MGTSADDKGQFKLEVPKSNKTLSVSYVGYETKEIETKNLPENMVIELNEANQTLEGEVVVVGFISRKMKVCTPEKEIPTEPPKETPLFTRIFKDSTFKNFKLYPNPVLQGMPISIQWAKPEDGEFEIQLLDQSGQLINRKTEMAKGKINFMKYSIPSVTPGSYFLVIINRKSGKKLTEKIIIQ
jgi:hypothetical protein